MCAKLFFKCYSPSTLEEWLQIAKSFEDRWQLPHSLGFFIKLTVALNSIITVYVTEYKFIFVDVGCQGRISDGDVLRNIEFWKALITGNCR